MNLKFIKKNKILILFINFVFLQTNAQEIIFGTNNYIEYQVGTLPLVISVSHGGIVEPSSIPNRTCNNPVNAVDVFTIETALEIKNKLFIQTGCYPHIIISHLKRNKLDPNRNLADGACGNPEAMIAWNEFHDFIADAQNTANIQYNNKTFFIDLHGHGNPVQRIELGYLLYDYELELTDDAINTTQYINYSSIKNLALNNINNYTHAQLIRGSNAFGTLLTTNNFPSVPSQSIPFPGTTSNYFSGGYITANHTCYNPAASINGLQMELNFYNLRDTSTNRTAFANAFAQTIIAYMNVHFDINWNACTPLSTSYNSIQKDLFVYPNPIKRGDLINFNLQENSKYDYQIYNFLGELVANGKLSSTTTINSENLNTGVYIIKISNTNETQSLNQKIIIQ